MSIKRLAVYNYRCFKSAEVDFRPITLLTGGNSSGKSALVSALLLQAQGKSNLVSPLNGEYCTMGEYRNVVYANDVSKDIRIEIDADSFRSMIFLKYNPDNIMEPFKEVVYSRGDGSDGIDGIDSYDNYIFSVMNNKKINDSSLKNKKLRKSQSGVEKRLNNVREDFKGLYLGDVSSMIIKQYVEYGKSIYKNNSFIDVVKSISSKEFDEELGKIRYIGPLRYSPRRGYLKDAKFDVSVAHDGANCASILWDWSIGGSKNIEKINAFGRELKLFDSITVVPGGDGVFYCKVKPCGASDFSSIQDMGFGVSQILPIIMNDLVNKKNSVSIISQPELHLHPSAQADLVEIFAKSVSVNKSQYILETHSDCMIARLRKLVYKNEISKDDVVIHHIENNGGKRNIHRITIDEDGTLVGSPNDYQATYASDIFELL